MKLKLLVTFLLLLFCLAPISHRTVSSNIATKKPVSSFAKNPEKLKLNISKEPHIKALYTNIRGSVYHCVANQTDETPFITASSYHIDTAKLNSRELRVVALSQDLIRIYGRGGQIKYSQKIYIKSKCKKLNGWWTVRDCMPGYVKRSIDFLQPVDGFSGMWYDIEIYTEDPTKGA